MDADTHEAMTTMAEFAGIKAPREILVAMFYLDTLRWGPLAAAAAKEQRKISNQEKVLALQEAFSTADVIIDWSKKNPPKTT